MSTRVCRGRSLPAVHKQPAAPAAGAHLLKSPQGMGMLHFCIALSRCLESLSQKLYAPVSGRGEQGQEVMCKVEPELTLVM